MFTFHEKDNHKIPSPARMHLPIPSEVTQSQVFDIPDNRSTEVLPPTPTKTRTLLILGGFKFTEIGGAGVTWNFCKGI